MANTMSVFTLLLFLLTFSNCVFAYKILAVISMPLSSHYMAFKPLFRELAVRGHQVTVMNSFPDKDPVPNMTFIDLNAHNIIRNATQTLEGHENIDSRISHLINAFKHVAALKMIMECCENIFINENSKAHNEVYIKYDVIFAEQFMSDCDLAYAAVMYDAPIIGITSHVLLPFSYSRLGISFDIAADAYYFSKSGPNPSLFEKVEVAIVNLFLTTFGRYNIQRDIYSIFKKYLPHKELDIEKAAKERMKMIFAYQHFSLTGARVLPPQLIEIAGLHIRAPKSVPKEIEQFLSDAKYGAIYVSFGSNLKASTMSKNKMQQFLSAFQKMPYKVIWKLENVTLPAGYDKIYTNNWLPQVDILCHPKVLAFISHGGMLSVSEATHCGKPILTIPFFGDQFSNAAAVRSIGLGKTLFFDRVNAQNLEETVRELTSEEMQQNAQRISKLWHDRPMSPMDSAIYWTEYVARHRSAPPSLPSKNTTWFQSLLIDVYATILAILLVVLFVLYRIVRLIKIILVKLFRQIFSKKVKKM